MKFALFIFTFLFSFGNYAYGLSIDNGLYYAYWVYGSIDNYKVSSLIADKPNKIGRNYYFINNISSESNNEVYMMVKDDRIYFFYKHDEIEGGPSIGWVEAALTDDRIIVGSPTVKNFYDDTDGDTDRNIKHKVGHEFSGNNRPAKEKEIIPLQKVNSRDFKIDCVSYFNENMKHNNISSYKDDPMKDYSKKVLMNYNGLCNLLLRKDKNEKMKNGWVLLKKIDDAK